MQTLMEHNGLVTGIIYQNTERLSYEELIKGYKEEPLVKQNLNLTEEQFDRLLSEFA
jgi:2-oxoglutarate/2-oxoacid ferredoxin oxidoreductase subunit beta